ncbi:MAG: hypothetical protein HWE25_02640 [Alphaproteobacteria bacterium]|nr:hypothetical protein [Alphaproteobacteria bacterium]
MTKEELEAKIAELETALDSLSGAQKIVARNKLTSIKNKLDVMETTAAWADFDVSELPDTAEIDAKVTAANEAIEARQNLANLVNGALDKVGGLLGLAL